jgi:hypothetical protein
VNVDISTAIFARGLPTGGTTKNGMFSLASPASSISAYDPDAKSVGTVHSCVAGQRQSTISSS